ncbi:hypothetical protein TEA_011640 [Camellia sinensis var. sinensis]|uniref:Bulb-type lectin domain-containing protein n=1 Tax=Camellia sinensis var. sinensis TaxID=542762 RepID=A0A4V3WKF0_CAMSN|nr:hypothetical protein TEA_011640 [Camellia sinensis var. sinensis]
MIMGIILFAISYYFSAFVLADGMLNQYQQINDSGALVSARGDFKLGFFSTSNLRSRYLGIWYNNIPVQTLIWVANRDRLLNDSSGGLKIGDDGNLILLDSGGIVAWSAGIQNISSKPTVALLLDSGNLVLRSENGGNTESYIWQSFDHPSDTLIAGMKLGWDLRVGLDRYLTSRKSADDPSPGDISYRFDLDGLPQGVIRKGSVKQHRTGIWNGLQFNGVEPQNSIFNTNFIDNSEESYVVVWMDTFLNHRKIGIRWFGMTCSCTVYANSDTTGGASGCLLWYGDLIDFKRFANPGDQTLYIRVTAAGLEYRSDSKEKKKKKLLLVIIPVSVALLSFLLTSCVMWKRIKQPRGSRPNIPFKDDENIDLPIFNIVTITNATNNFSISNKIGEGGFGLVYKAWKLWIEENAIQLVVKKLETPAMLTLEVLKCIQIGLLCVQQCPEDRPTMSSVVSMLDNGSAMLPHPRQRGFYNEESSDEIELASTVGIKCSTNETTIMR